ncbi:hypothetical protein [Ruegeria sp. HKCCA5426]|nr:hypothetical protein [Ruegeria sp. HKCCA5426]
MVEKLYLDVVICTTGDGADLDEFFGHMSVWDNKGWATRRKAHRFIE